MSLIARTAGLCLALVLACWVFPGAAGALSSPPQITFDVEGGTQGPQPFNAFGTASTVNDVTTWTLTAPQTVEGVSVDSWMAILKEDPYVNNNITVTNTTGATQTFIATVLLPIQAFDYSAVVSSTFGVTLTDSNGNNVLSFAQSAGTAIYQGTVNGATLLSMNPSVVPLTQANCQFPGPNLPGCTAVDGAGTAFLAAAGTANNLGITLTFALSPGDSAGLTSRFEIVPEPGTAALLVLGLVGLAASRRR